MTALFLRPGGVQVWPLGLQDGRFQSGSQGPGSGPVLPSTIANNDADDREV